jgi:2-polyprenyl-6-methoxyphenol hydroxylase-like FAD-dependent oxidoreductase
LPAIQNALIVGGGSAGLSSAIALRRLGIDAEVIELKPDWAILGSGVTMMGATLRALGELGLADECVERGAGGFEVGIYDEAGTELQVVPLPSIAGSERPAIAGIMRPELHGMLLKAAEKTGASIRLGATVTSLAQHSDRVEVTLSDGSERPYDLVIGADGLHSRIRSMIFEHPLEPSWTGQMVWRAIVERPADYANLAMFYGKRTKAGINAVSKTQAYLFLADNEFRTELPPREQWPAILREALAEYTGPIAAIRETITDPAVIDWRGLQGLLLPEPWYNDRVVLIGDAVHASTPQLAMGAGLAIEDSLVLAELLGSSSSVADALEAFTARRYERCRMVVENSLQLGKWEQHPEDPNADPGGLSERSWAELAAPI